jgi:hypothetical protein
VPDWDFILKNSEAVERPRNSDCPSLTTGSTISSRNSSTRSARSIKMDSLEGQDKGMCPYPDCGRVLRDLPAHLLTHQAERPEKCPVGDCEYHVKGFARAYDRVRHTLSHFKENMACGFCPTSVFGLSIVAMPFLNILLLLMASNQRQRAERTTSMARGSNHRII